MNNLIRRMCHHGSVAEHFCLVGYSLVEVIGQHALLWWFSAAMVFTGVAAILFERFFEAAK
jgi:hypothetical protein